jgi:hypothetical protein
MTTATVDAAATVPRPATTGPEMEALARFYPDVTWTGTVAAGGMGRGTPEMTAIGRASHRLIQDGRWIVVTCSQEQYLLDGTFVLTWQLHLVVGWDPAHGDYRATIADNYGHAAVLRGRIDRDLLVLETLDDARPRLRMTWDASDPTRLTWRNESSVDGRDWSLIESYTMTPTYSAGAGIKRA